MKNFIPTSKITSAGALLENAGIVKPVPRVRWEMSRTVPAHVKAARIEAENKADKQAIKDALNAFRSPRRARPVILG